MIENPYIPTHKTIIYPIDYNKHHAGNVLTVAGPSSPAHKGYHEWSAHESRRRHLSVRYVSAYAAIEKKKFDVQRNLNFFFINCFVSGPVLHMWYSKLLPLIHARLFPKASQIASVVYRMLIDQLLFTPLLYCGFYPLLQVVGDRDIRSFGKGVEKAR